VTHTEFDREKTGSRVYRQPYAAHGAVLALTMALAACAQTQTPSPEYPSSRSELCRHLGLESTQTVQHEDRDATSLVAVYTWNDPNTLPAKQPWRLKVQSDRSRVDEPQGLLESRGQVVCGPENRAHAHEPMPAVPIQNAPPKPREPEATVNAAKSEEVEIVPVPAAP